MTKAAIINSSGVIQNIIEIDPMNIPFVKGLIIAKGDEKFEIGGKWILGEYTPPIENKIVPTFISRRQLIMGLVNENIISSSDALIAARGEIPTVFDTFLNSLSVSDKLNAQIAWASVNEFDRNNVFLNEVFKYLEKTNDYIDDFFIKYSLV